MALLGLRWSSWLLVCLLPATWFALAANNAANVALFPALLVSPALLVWACYFRWARVRCQPSPPDDSFVRMFFAGAGPGAILSIFAEAIVSQQLAGILLSSKDDEEAASTSIVWIYILATAYVTAALVEEAAKAALVRCACCACWCGQRRDPLRPALQAHTTVALFLAATLGFATAENIMYVFGGAVPGGTPEEVAARALLVVIRSAVSLPLHVVCASFTALRLTLRDAQLSTNDAQWAAVYASSVLRMTFPAPPPILATTSTIAAAASPGATAPDRSTGSSLAPLAVPSANTASPAEVDEVGRHLQLLLAGGQVQGRQQQQQQLAEVRVLIPAAAPQAMPTGAALDAPLPATPHAPLAVVGGVLAPPPPPVRVWSWVRVLWPAVAVHGTFDAVAMLLPVVAAGTLSDLSIAATVLVVGCTVLVTAAAFLTAQFHHVFEAIASGIVPRSVTHDSGVPLFRPLLSAIRWALCSCQYVPSVPDADAAANAALAAQLLARLAPAAHPAAGAGAHPPARALPPSLAVSVLPASSRAQASSGQAPSQEGPVQASSVSAAGQLTAAEADARSVRPEREQQLGDDADNAPLLPRSEAASP
jgi:RsiW-degrading membrane proteinase PrsW (M82 family)